MTTSNPAAVGFYRQKNCMQKFCLKLHCQYVAGAAIAATDYFAYNFCRETLCMWRRAVSIRPSVCLSAGHVLTKWVNVFSNFYSPSGRPSVLVVSTKCYGNIPTWTL